MTGKPLDAVLAAIADWGREGQSACLKLLTSLVAQPEVAADLSDVIQALLVSILPTFSKTTHLETAPLVAFLHTFVQTVLSHSSHNTQDVFSDIIIDCIYVLDDVFDERVTDKSAPIEQDRQTLAKLVNDLIQLSILPVDKCRERLLLGLPFNSGISNLGSFEKKEVRARTDLIYKQNKFNLLREQSEGYTKLIVEVVSSIGPPHSTSTKLPVEHIEVIRARASAAWDKVVSLVGYFDLDPNRALDVILDIFSAHIITHYTFFLELLKCSPWSRSPPLKRGNDAMVVDSENGRYAGMGFDEAIFFAESNAQVEEADVAKDDAMVHAKPQVCSQILGFKFQHYHRVSEPPPESLFMMAALLIRERFIEIRDLLPHLAPSDDDMVKLEGQYRTGLLEAIRDAKTTASDPDNALGKAQPLTDDSIRSSRSAPVPTPAPKPTRPKKPLPEPRAENLNQKVGLLKSLLATGTLRPAIYILGKFPCLPKQFPTVADLILVILQQMITPLYQQVSTSVRYPEHIAAYLKGKAKFVPGVGPSSPTPPRETPTIQAPLGFCTTSTSLTFFYPAWTDWIPSCSSIAEITNVLEPLMRFVSLHMCRDRSFLSKLCRIARSEMFNDNEKSQCSQYRLLWIQLTRRYFLPCLSMLRDCPAFAIQVWNVVRLFSTSERWSLYAEWKERTYKQSLELQLRFAEVNRESKGILRRISVRNSHTLGRPLGKLAHSNPCIVFYNAVTQVQAYDNLAEPVIDTLKSITVMGYDVLMFLLLDAFSNQDKARMKEDGTNTSHWILSLSSFTGQLFKKFPLINPQHMMRYVVNQLRNHQTGDYTILQDIISKMTGIEPLRDLSKPQILAMGGGPTLRVEAVASELRGALQPKLGQLLKARDRIISSLTNPADPLALPLLILLAQQRQSCVFRVPEHDLHLKGMGSLFDDVQNVLFQYIELLSTALSTQAYANLLPSVADLVQKYGLEPSIVMHIHRPRLHEAILAYALEAQQKLDAVKAGESAEDAEKRLKREAKAALAAKRDSPAAVPKTLPTDSTDVSSLKSLENGDSTVTLAPVWLPMLQPVIEDVRRILPPETHNMMGPAFFVTFWQLSGYDINPPLLRYEEESLRLRKLIDPKGSRSERERLTSTIESLSKEVKTHLIARQFTLKRLQREKTSWFPADASLDRHMGMLTAQLIQYCFWPRALLSPMDADFCSQFIKTLHTMGTPGFSTLRCYDKLLSDQVGALVFSCTQNEARNFGRFLAGILRELLAWHKDEKLYASENKDKRGGSLFGFRHRTSANQTAEVMTWESFKTVHNKWHKKLSANLAASLESNEYMHVYNAVIVLQEIIDVFPIAAVNSATGAFIELKMQDVLDRESMKAAKDQREDLKVFANAYLSRIRTRKHLWEPSPEKIGATPVKPIPSSGPAPALEGTRLKSASNGAVVAPSSPRPLNGGGPSRPLNGIPPATVHPLPANPSRPSQDATLDRTAAARLAMESIPRPEIVKRVRKPEIDLKSESNSGPPTPPSTTVPSQDELNGAATAIMPVDASEVSLPIKSDPSKSSSSSSSRVGSLPQGPKKEIPQGPKKEIPQGPKKDLGRQNDESSNRMPPPTAPSSTTVAHELRNKSSTGQRSGDEKSEIKLVDPRSRDRSTPSSPRRRSPSPNRQRNGSADSRGSAGERGRDDKLERRSSITASRHDRDGDRTPADNRRGRRDDERERERERGEKERERDRDRGREREKERERDDRHRRDTDKDRERESHSDRRDRDREPPSRTLSSAPGPSRGQEESSRTQELSRSRPGPGSDDNPNKRRRPVDDEPDRGAKRTTRHRAERDREGHRDSGTRHRDKDRHRDTDSSRKTTRKDRDSRPDESGTAGDKERPKEKGPEGPERQPTEKPRIPEAIPSTTKHSLQVPPSAPRAMAARADSPGRSRSDHPPLNGGRDSRSTWKGRDSHESQSHNQTNGGGPIPPSGPAASRASSGVVNPEPVPSLRSRISDDTSARSGPQPPLGPSASRSERETTHGDRSSISARDDPSKPSDNTKKRTITDRTKEDRPKEGETAEAQNPPSKRPRINRVPKYSLDAVHDHLGDKGGRLGSRKDSLV